MQILSLHTYETGGVVVADGLGVTVGLQGRVGLDNLLLKGTGVGTLGSLGLGSLCEREKGMRNMRNAKNHPSLQSIIRFFEQIHSFSLFSFLTLGSAQFKA